MFGIEIAGATFGIHNLYPLVYETSRDYLTEKTPECTITVTPDDIAECMNQANTRSAPYGETVYVYRKIYEYLMPRDVLAFHSSTLAFDGKAYAFTAPSGTGKSTHARLWRERFGERVVMINDDKPLLSFEGGGFRAWGTPWCGKEELNTNISAPLCGIVVLHQAGENKMERIGEKEAFALLFPQIYQPKDPSARLGVLRLIAELCKLPVYSLGCTPTQDAVTLCHGVLTGTIHSEEQVK